MAVHGHLCSREHSRQARKIIAKSVYPYLGKDPASIFPSECPLHPDIDVFKDQEAHKKLAPQERDVFQCGYCQKQFKTEFYMDRHMDNKHPDKLNLDLEADVEDMADIGNSTRCLGDLCPVLGCGQYDAGDCSVTISSGGGEEGVVRRGCGVCDPADMERRRHECEALFGRCLDISEGSAAARAEESGLKIGHVGDLRGYFVNQFCDHLACDSHHRPLFPALEGKGAAGRHPVAGSVGDGRGGVGMLKASLITVLVVGLIILYSGMALGHRSRWTRKDLSRHPWRERAGRKEEIGGRSSSVRGYTELRRRGLNRALG